MIAVIGAGISGLCSALTLSRLGHKVLLLDKGRSAGGRLATRYLEAESGQGYINTAAHEINVDDASPQFTKIMHEFFPSQCSPDGRYRAPKGINWFTKHLASYLKDQSVDVHFEQTVNKIGYSKSSKIFTIATNTTSFEASGLVLTLPYPQSRNLLDTCDEIRLDPGHLPQYYKSLLLLLWPKEVVLPGSLPSSANIHKVVLQDKIQANRSPYPLAVHATYAWSREHFSCADQSIKERLMEELHLQETDFIRVSVKRWVRIYCLSDLADHCRALLSQSSEISP